MKKGTSMQRKKAEQTCPFFALLRKYKIATLEKFDVVAIFGKTV
jgi:hypothetical protein